MKVVILAGGLGTRLMEETQTRPKPMVEIGGIPILCHIMSHYSAYGFDDFVICLGYKGYIIKEYFANFVLHRSDVTVDLARNSVAFSRNEHVPPWRVSLIDTGAETMTGGRLKRIRHMLPDNEPFMMTYGDGLSDVDLQSLLHFHQSRGLDATVTTVRPPGRFGATQIEDGRVVRFIEKPLGDGGYINGGFFVLHPRVIDRVADDQTPWEAEPLTGLAADGQLAAFVHDGFWQPMDTLRDRQQLERMWAEDAAPWAKAVRQRGLLAA
ncbi:glucose-1-phosphate cytidylyltransferase [Microvirga lenta]|uniref:glucose-1-phosphate cytidylyltransferase n=1 Tax=Microvirga lenta TaxID=2881337 RepID=UPI001CFD87C6|nr:glucose-1-phosphate cytidylyltransferase [Microvirga lenta]MCB5173561.1 glucose-1-phosphate cytidylyltransferase [Microvirga lenta]